MIAIAVFLTLVGCGAAFPARSSSDPATVIGVPVLIEDPTGLKPAADSSPLVYGLLLSRLSPPEDTVNSGSIAKRSATMDEEDQDDLETAAGTYALRPLFVYRQQLAYRERVREANRRGYRF
ncbi:uncharacterized protein LOC143259184 [Megalopta genalis]|uniref:uncharacterized protein LOC143259184 n=1 Tax=Megalopta genalis TaxID=115081 RepID=UPI003FD589A9